MKNQDKKLGRQSVEQPTNKQTKQDNTNRPDFDTTKNQAQNQKRSIEGIDDIEVDDSSIDEDLD